MSRSRADARRVLARPGHRRRDAGARRAAVGRHPRHGGADRHAKNVLTVKVLNRTNGAYPDSKVFWSFDRQTHSIAERPFLDMPANSAGFRAVVPAEFDHLAQGTDKILSPGGDPQFKPGGKYANYFSPATITATSSEILGCAGPPANKPNDCARSGFRPAAR